MKMSKSLYFNVDRDVALQMMNTAISLGHLKIQGGRGTLIINIDSYLYEPTSDDQEPSYGALRTDQDISIASSMALYILDSWGAKITSTKPKVEARPIYAANPDDYVDTLGKSTYNGEEGYHRKNDSYREPGTIYGSSTDTMLGMSLNNDSIYNM